LIKFAVISFPGTNCENENVRAFKRNGMEAETVLWNDPGILDGSRLSEFDGYCIAGGFSYEDRGRSGVVAAQDPIMDVIRKEADAGKIVLGICNGAQILVETGLIPGFDNRSLGLALAWNEMKEDDKIVDTGFYNAWSYLKNTAPKNRTAFNNFDELIHVPFAHGEGRFMIDDELLSKLKENKQILFRYADKDGNIDCSYPVTPNGATDGIAGISNPAGNVMAIMPHPERDPLGGTGNLIFKSIKNYLESKYRTEFKSLGDGEIKSYIANEKDFDLKIFLRLIITDNTERTIEELLNRRGYKINLERFEFFGINLKSGTDIMSTAEKILNSGELANFSKHLVYVKIDGEMFQYDPVEGFLPNDLRPDCYLITGDQKDFVGQAKKASLDAHTESRVESVSYGVLWNLIKTNHETIDRVIDSNILYNPHSMYLVKHV